MAIAFELVVNYGHDEVALGIARQLITACPPLVAGRYRVPLHEPLITAVRNPTRERYFEMAVLPARVGYGVGLDGDQPRLPLTAGELSELGSGLYSLLAKLTGYRVAQVGWDPESFVDLDELRQEWAEELATGALPGLVLAEDLQLGVPLQGFVPFAPGFLWIPYRGEQPSSLSAASAR